MPVVMRKAASPKRKTAAKRKAASPKRKTAAKRKAASPKRKTAAKRKAASPKRKTAAKRKAASPKRKTAVSKRKNKNPKGNFTRYDDATEEEALKIYKLKTGRDFYTDAYSGIQTMKDSAEKKLNMIANKIADRKAKKFALENVGEAIGTRQFKAGMRYKHLGGAKYEPYDSKQSRNS